MILDIKNFSCGYKNKFWINDINISLRKSDFVGVVGPNGSGKTTLFKGITATIKTMRGNVFLMGEDIHSLSFKQRALKMAVVSQKIENPDITVADYVLMGRLPHRKQFQFFDNQKDIEVANNYMQLTNILHIKNKNMTELSGGEQQLAAIARALTQEPEILLLDEPTSHLDIGHQAQILNLIGRLNKEMKLTVLMIIHDLNLAGEYCNFLVMMKEGKMKISGTPDEVLNYKIIEDVYGTVVVTQKNPVSGKPAVFTVSENNIKESKKQK